MERDKVSKLEQLQNLRVRQLARWDERLETERRTDVRKAREALAEAERVGSTKLKGIKKTPNKKAKVRRHKDTKGKKL